jgi:phytoene dehydrogenase-like protein
VTSWEVIVIGAGHNGLVAAAYLARAGRRALALERRPIVGGACVTEEFHPGFRTSTFSYATSLLHPRIIDELALRRHGLTLMAKNPTYFVPFPDGEHLFLWAETERSQAEIARFSRRDAEAYPRFLRFWDEAAWLWDETVLDAPPSLTELAARFGTPEREETYRRLFTLSIADLLDLYFEDDRIKAVLSTSGIIGSRVGVRTPGSAWIWYLHNVGTALGERGRWGYARGGQGAVTAALAAAAREAGAEIRTDAEVARLLVEQERVAGVVMANGDEYRAPVVLSNADPKRTFLKLVEPKHLPEAFRARVGQIRMNGVSFKLNLALAELPDYIARPGREPGPQHQATMNVAPSLDYLEAAWADAQAGRPSREPWIEAYIATTLDDSLAPPGRHLMSIFAQYAPYDLAEGDWEQEGDRFADRCLETVAAYAPNLPGAVIARDAISPIEIEKRLGLTGGHIFQGEMTPDQLFSLRPVPGASRYRTPLPGLYLCGAGTHPGGCVMGAPGYNAAQAVLRDLTGE